MQTSFIYDCAPHFVHLACISSGKERDPESTLDDFGARYYSSAIGRWMSADWSAIPEPVPYANLTNPQTLNLYAMVHDNPETFADLDGHGAIAMSSQGNTIAGTLPESTDPQLEQQQAQQAAQNNSVGFTVEKNVVNETDTDKSVGLTGNTKIIGGSVNGNASANPSQLSAKASADAEVHGVKSELNFSSNPNGGPGLANGTVSVSAFTAGAGASFGTNGVTAQAETSVVSFGGSLNIGKLTLTGTVNAVAAGGQFSITKSGFSIGANALLGADVKVQWGSTTIKTVSAEAQ
jgi:RHS repeat-associated protein